MAFEVFDRAMDGMAAREFPQVLISATGQIVLNAAAKLELDRLRPPATKMVELLYDRDMRKVAIRPVDSSTPGSKRFAVSTARSRTWPRVIEAREFCEFWKLPQGRQQAFRVEASVIGLSSVLVFDLREANGEATA